MKFVDRRRELERLARAFGAGGVVCVWGRRRVGKSRLLREAVTGRNVAWVAGDDRDVPLQRMAVARAVGTVIPGFEAAIYPTWDALLERLWRDAPSGAVLVLDEFPALVTRAPELPGVLQRLIDAGGGPAVALCGSSQRMMHGLVLDAGAPLYGRASEVLRIGPIAPRWMGEALGLNDPVEIVQRYAVFGGIPRYWELSARFVDLRAAVEDLVLDPLGVLHDEPERLLLDDVREIARAASILALIGQGCSRLSEIAARIGQPATSLTRPVERLLSLGLVARDIPFGASPRDGKRSLYRIDDPLLAFWYRFVEPNRSRLAAGGLDGVAREVWAGFRPHLGLSWEALVRWRIPRAAVRGAQWGPASRWWGNGTDGRPLELDAVAAGVDSDAVLVVEAKLQVGPGQVAARLDDLRARAARCPALVGKRCEFALWTMEPVDGALGAADVVEAE